MEKLEENQTNGLPRFQGPSHFAVRPLFTQSMFFRLLCSTAPQLPSFVIAIHGGVDLIMGERRGARFRHAYDGRWLYNCHCNGGVFNLGHRHPEIVDAVRSALDALDIGNHHLVSGWRATLVGLPPRSLSRSFRSLHNGLVDDLRIMNSAAGMRNDRRLALAGGAALYFQCHLSHV